LIIGVVVGAISGALFVTTFSSSVGLGDGPETVSGVRTLGVLHAPGYAIYVLVARIFANIVHLGSWSFRVNLFSVVCATLTITGTYFVARCLGASRVGAGLGSLALATTASFWFNAGFAKHYAFSALLLIMIAACAVSWGMWPHSSLLIVGAAITGLSIGAAWQETIVFASGLGAFVAVAPHRPRGRVLVGITAALVLGASVAATYTMWRAMQDPGMNFGDASSVSRLVHLATTRDFGAPQGVTGRSVFVSGADYLAIIVRDIGLGAVLVACLGAWDVIQRRRLDQALFFAIAGLGTFVAVGLAATVGSLTRGTIRIAGFYTSLAAGGQLVGLMIVLSLLTALGSSWLIHMVGAWWHKIHARGDREATRVRAVVAGVIAAVMVMPSAIFHYRPATHRIPPLADQYGSAVLRSLPPNAVFIASGWEFAQPVVYRQLVDHERPDVAVVSVDFLNKAWYRSQIVHRFHLDAALLQLPIPPSSKQSAQQFQTQLALLRRSRPVFVDAKLMTFGKNTFGWEDEGLVGRIVDGLGPYIPNNLAEVAAALHEEEQRDGLLRTQYTGFPNNEINYFHLRAHVELAKAYALKNDLDGAANELERVLVFAPKGTDRALIDETRAHTPNARAQILGL
jgi:hypothetical protein